MLDDTFLKKIGLVTESSTAKFTTNSPLAKDLLEDLMRVSIQVDGVKLKKCKTKAPELLEIMIKLLNIVEHASGGFGYEIDCSRELIHDITELSWEEVKEILDLE